MDPWLIQEAAVSVRRILHLEGIEALSLRAIARDLNCSPSMLSQRFGSREMLMHRTVGFLGDLWLTGLDRPRVPRRRGVAAAS